MIAELISVGTELLMGMIVNTNAAYLAEQCVDCGLSVFHQSVVGDNEKRLEEAVAGALKRSDVILITGGLGPTQDDLTKEVVAKLCGMPLVMHNPSKEAIVTYFAKRGLLPTDNNWKQAMVPEGCIVVDNANGTAPGIIIEQNGKVIILMPGPPQELKAMFESQIKKYLNQLQEDVFYTKVIKVCGIGESQLETMIYDLIELQTNPTIATYANPGDVHIRITAKSSSMEEAKLLLRPIQDELKVRFGTAIYAQESHITLEDSIVKELKKQNLTITTAESCTGGMCASRLIAVSGASTVFGQGYITYANEAKHKILGVKWKTLKKYGAVSKEVAQEMSKGAVKVSGASCSISITGIAGPEGGTEEKPVGLVYVSCCIGKNLWVQCFQFSGNRQKIRESSTTQSLIFFRKCLLEIEK